MTVLDAVDLGRTDHRLADLTPIDLPSLEAVARLTTRFDRKYVVDPTTVDEMIDALAGRCEVLEIDGLRTFRYSSLYFDTPDLCSYRGAAHGRRQRWKVRSRVYEEQGTCTLEVKTKTVRGQTVKERLPYDVADRRVLTTAGRAFVEERLPVEGLTSELAPVVQTAYRRSTLVDRLDGSRTTIDRALTCSDPIGTCPLGFGDVVVETKSTGAATAVDKWLWRDGNRPIRISKFCVGMALHDPTLPANRWARVLRRHFDWEPATRSS